jgi:UDP-GlcNAc:undecaprenyl-phosphate GlcNAc-1-phosphate transferase
LKEEDIATNYLFIVIASFLLSILFILLFRRIASKYNILKLQDIPLIGGIGMGISFLIVSLIILFLFKVLSLEMFGIILSSLLMLVFGIIDDWRELSVIAKFLVQIIAATLLIIFGVRTQIMYMGSLTNIIITYVWVLAITNAFNHLDVLDGLASGVAILVGSSFFVISLMNQQSAIAILTLTLSAATFGFLIFNFPPARIYMGNCGSHFLGFVLAAIALVISYASLERKIAILSPLLILGLPIFDTGFLIWARIIKKRLPFKKSNDHLALRLLALGYSKKKALAIMLALGLFFSFCGVLISQVSNSLGILIIVIVLTTTLVITQGMGRISMDD